MTDPRELEREFSEPWTRVSYEWVELESNVDPADRITHLHRDTDIPGVDLTAIYGPDAPDSGANLAVGHGDPVALDPDEILDLVKSLLVTYNLASDDIPTDPVAFLESRESISQSILEGVTHANNHTADAFGPVKQLLESEEPRHLHHVDRELDELLKTLAWTLRDVDAAEQILHERWADENSEEWTLEMESEDTEGGDRDD